MKKIYQYLAISFLGMCLTNCSDDELIPSSSVQMGDEILFGASASIENGDAKNSRTAYGDVNAEKNKINIDWCYGDQLEIACPQSVAQTMATYQIPLGGNAQGGVVDGGTDGNQSTVTTLERVTTGAGLQWGTGAHDFYAIYPSSGQYNTDKIEYIKLDANQKKVTGLMPSTYDAKASLTTLNGHRVYKAAPSMDFAYMVAHTHMDAASDNVALKFNPIVTALEFDITADQIGVGDNGVSGYDEIKINRLVLESKTQSLVGEFTYNFGNTPDDNGTITNNSAILEGYGTINMTFVGDQNVLIKEGDKLQATFFVIPTEDPSKNFDLQANDLSLTIFFEADNIIYQKKAKIGQGLNARKKYFFKNMLMPKLSSLSSSNWFSALNDKIYISQLSFPVAGHVVSNQYKAYDKNYKREQVHGFNRLWDLGIRGFEFRSSFKGTSAADFSRSPFVCSGTEISGAVGNTKLNLGPAIEESYRKIVANPRETLVLLLTYQSYGGDNSYGYRPDLYLQGLQNYLDYFVENVAKKPAKDVFVKLGTSSTVSELRGKIAIVVRLYDNHYVSFSNRGKGKTDPNRINTSKLAPSGKWGKYISVIDNWGTCVDNWDMRYGTQWAREGIFDAVGKQKFEDNMWYGLSTSDQKYIDGWRNGPYEHLAAEPYPTYSFDNYRLNVNTGFNENSASGEALVQCWERVIPTTHRYYLGNNSSKTEGFIFYEWPASIDEKVKAIQYVANQAMSTKGKDVSTSDVKLFVNSLAGYFPTTHGNMPGSCNPYLADDDKFYNVQLGKQVTGGNYAFCAGVLNAYFYKYLTRVAPENMGPLGLVLIDYIDASADDFTGIDEVNYTVTGYEKKVNATHASQASIALPKLILGNNFKFPLKRKEQTSIEGGSNQQEGGDIIFPGFQ